MHVQKPKSPTAGPKLRSWRPSVVRKTRIYFTVSSRFFSRWHSTRCFPSRHPIDLLTDALQLLLLLLFGSLESDMRLTCPAHRSCDALMSGSALGVLALLSTSTSGTLSCQWIPRIWRRCRSWILALAQRTKGFGGSLNPTLYFQIWWIVACNCATEIDEILSWGECWSIHQLSYYHTF